MTEKIIERIGKVQNTIIFVSLFISYIGITAWQESRHLNKLYQIQNLAEGIKAEQINLFIKSNSNWIKSIVDSLEVELDRNLNIKLDWKNYKSYQSLETSIDIPKKQKEFLVIDPNRKVKISTEDHIGKIAKILTRDSIFSVTYPSAIISCKDTLDKKNIDKSRYEIDKFYFYHKDSILYINFTEYVYTGTEAKERTPIQPLEIKCKCEIGTDTLPFISKKWFNENHPEIAEISEIRKGVPLKNLIDEEEEKFNQNFSSIKSDFLGVKIKNKNLGVIGILTLLYLNIVFLSYLQEMKASTNQANHWMFFNNLWSRILRPITIILIPNLSILVITFVLMKINMSIALLISAIFLTLSLLILQRIKINTVTK